MGKTSQNRVKFWGMHTLLEDTETSTSHRCHDRDGHENTDRVIILLDEQTQHRRSQQEQDEWIFELLQVFLVQRVLRLGTKVMRTGSHLLPKVT